MLSQLFRHGTKRETKTKGKGEGTKQRRIVMRQPKAPDAPFPNKGEDTTNILVSDKGFGYPRGRDIPREGQYPYSVLFKTLAKDEKASVVTSDLIHHEIRSQTLSVAGFNKSSHFNLLDVGRRNRMSRMRNFEADAWRGLATERADAYVYHVEIEHIDTYLSKGEDYYSSAGWESDRYAISHLLQKPHLVENPNKPLVLLVNNRDDGRSEEDFDIGRLVNLFGLERLTRPFRGLPYSSVDDVKEALEWIGAKARSHTDEAATAITADETEDENSIATSNTAFPPDADVYVLDYEPTLSGGNATLQRFEPIKKNTHCPFARAAKLWGGKLADETVPRLRDRFTMEDVAQLNAGPLAEFVARVDSGEALDGFCLGIPGADWLEPKRLGEKVRQLLTTLAELNPTSGENAMKSMGPIDSPTWSFRFAGEDFFITTFSSAYKETSSRYTFGVRQAFILFQPMTSFGRHGLTHDTPASTTKWDNPISMRDKARVAFKNAGCPYHIPEELPYPVAEHVVKPMVDDGKNVVKWWEPIEKKNNEESSIEE